MNDFVIDTFLTGFLGGIAGAGISCLALHYHLKTMYLRYKCAKEDVIDLVCYKRLEKEVEKIKHNVEVLTRESYEVFSKEDLQ